MDRVRAWVLLTALGVAAGCVQLLRAESATLEESLGSLGRWAVASAVVAAVAVAAWAGISEVRRRRAAQRAVVVQALTSAAVAVTGQHPGGHTVRVAKWARLEPRRIIVRYPKKHDPIGAAGRLASAIGEATPAGAAPRGWKATHSAMRHRYVLEPKPELEGESQAREEAEHRVVALVKKTIPGSRSVTVEQWDDAHSPTRFAARYEPSPRLSSDRLKAAVTRVISDNFPGRWVAEWDHEHDCVTFFVRPELPTVARREKGLAPLEDRLVLRYGIADDGSVQGWDLDGTQPHCLVIGPTGGGKTVALRAIALDAISQGVTVYGLDPKQIELMGLIGVPGVAKIATEPEDMQDLLYEMRDMMYQRYQRIKARTITRKQLEPVLFILDEFFILRMLLNKLWQSDPEAKGKVNPALDGVSELLALARSARIHLAIGIQRPDSEFLGGASRDNVRHRVALNAVSAQGSTMLWEVPDVGLDLPEIAGRAVATGPGNRPHEVQVFWLPDPDPYLDGVRSAEDQELLDELLAGAPTWAGQSRPEVRPREIEPAAPTGDIPPTGRELEETDEPAGVGERSPVDHEDVVDEVSPAAEPQESAVEQWAAVPAEQVVAGDTVRLEGESTVVLTATDLDPLEEDYVVLEWDEGSVSVPASESVDRAVWPVQDEAA